MTLVSTLCTWFFPALLGKVFVHLNPGGHSFTLGVTCVSHSLTPSLTRTQSGQESPSRSLISRMA
jgi:hypothetical protein